MNSINAFSSPVQQLYIGSARPKFGTLPNIPANGAVRPTRPMFGTTVSANPNFSGHGDTFERRKP